MSLYDDVAREALHGYLNERPPLDDVPDPPVHGKQEICKHEPGEFVKWFGEWEKDD